MNKYATDTLYLLVAGYAIRISFEPTDWQKKSDLLHQSISKHLGEFISAKAPKTLDARIIIREIAGIPFEYKRGVAYNRYFETAGKKTYVTYYHTSIYEFTQLLLIILIDLLNGNGFLLHASGVRDGNGIVLFMGESGDGKSTVVHNLKEHYPLFSDDCVVIKKTSDGYGLYRAPWIEKDGISFTGENKPYKIKRIFTLKKNRPFKIASLSGDECVFEVIKNMWTIDVLKKKPLKSVLEFCGQFARFYRLSWELQNKGELVRGLSSYKEPALEETLMEKKK